MGRLIQGTVYRPTVTRLKKGRRVKTRSRYYWAEYCDATAERQRHVLKLSNGMRVTDKDIARAELQKINARIEREAAGLVDPFVQSAGMPIRIVLARYIRHLRRKQVSKRHLKQTVSCVKWVIEHTEMMKLADFTEDRIDRALGLLADAERSPRTVNVYRRCVHSMAEWALKVARVLDRNPVAMIQKRQESADIRKVRRALSIEEAQRLIGACGPRGLFYTVQLWTGLRVRETAALEWRDVRLDGPRPSILLRAHTTKAKRADELPIHAGLVKLLLGHRPPLPASTDRVFRTTPTLRTFKADLKRAGIEFADEQGCTVDRHALRTTLVS